MKQRPASGIPVELFEAGRGIILFFSSTLLIRFEALLLLDAVVASCRTRGKDGFRVVEILVAGDRQRSDAGVKKRTIFHVNCPIKG